MILIKVWRPRAGLRPRSYRRVSAALGLILNRSRRADAGLAVVV